MELSIEFEALTSTNFFGTIRKHRPSDTRPARPARCCKLLLDAQSISNDVKLLIRFVVRNFVRQKSTTASNNKINPWKYSEKFENIQKYSEILKISSPYLTSGTVIELSAIFVDKIILRKSGSVCLKIAR